jgi:hypothetical protein
MLKIKNNTNRLDSLAQSDVHLGLSGAEHLTLSSLEATQQL